MTPTSLRLGVVTLCLAATSVYLTAANRDEVLPSRPALATIPMALDGWSGRREADLTPEVLKVLGAEDYIVRTYFRDQAWVSLYVGYHATQRQGDTIHSPLNCLPGAGWIPLEQGRKTINVDGVPGQIAPTPIEINRVVIGKGVDRQLVLYWYQTPRRVVASEYMGKVYTVLDSVRYHRTDAALVRVITPFEEGGEGQSEERAERFAEKLFPTLVKQFPL